MSDMTLERAKELADYKNIELDQLKSQLAECQRQRDELAAMFVEGDSSDSITKPLPEAANIVLAAHDAALVAPTIRALERAETLASIANDWNLGQDGQIEIGDEWVSCASLRQEFSAELARLRAIGKP